MTEEEIDKNLRRGGEFFIYSLWIQSQMTDLIIFSHHPLIIKKFVNRSEKIPSTLNNERVKLWQKDFWFVKEEFVKRFKNVLSQQAITDINTVYLVRNAIAHSHVSLGRKYFLYRPASKSKLNELKRVLGVRKPLSDIATPKIFKFDFSNDEIYLSNFNAIQRMDEEHLKTIATSLGISHSRIR